MNSPGPSPSVRRVALAPALTSLVSVGGGLTLTALSQRIDDAAVAPAELGAALACVGAFILWHRPANRIGALLAITGMLFSLGVLAAGVLDRAASAGPAWHPVAEAGLAYLWLTAGLAAPWTLFVLWFPTGDMRSRAWRRFFLVAAVACVVLPLGGYLVAPAGTVPGIFSTAPLPAGIAGPFAGRGGSPLGAVDNALLLLPLVAVVRLVQRYRAAGVVVRQQIKWLAAAALATILGGILASLLHAAGGAGRALAIAVTLATQPLPALATVVAIFRYRLWEIDVVVSRAIVHALLWGLLSVLLLVPALATGLIVGGPSTLAAVGLALLVTLAFEPLRTRLERVIDRLVFRGRPRGYTLLMKLSETLRAAVELSDLGAEVAETVRSGLGVTWAGVWVRVESGETSALRPVGTVGMEDPVSMILSEADARRLAASEDGLGGDAVQGLADLWSEPPAVAIPLVAGDEVVGLLACGQRPGDPLGDTDREVLGVLARECALALRARRLEAQLRERLQQIEQQADALLHSRQRLVSAQDEQRRHIERDLHDGVQQQLVALAVQLRRMGGADAPAGGDALQHVAAEAEEAVFALQELARGIFPSVLADQGLVAALRTQAARLPLDVRVEVEPGLSGRRFEREAEAALYFVALEAMANAQKHAPSAPVTVSVRMESQGRAIVLEVHDSGPGFDPAAPRAGTGLQNMTDRIAAAGGALRVESRRDAGTWIRAQIPVVAAPVVLHMPEADSRR
jgi:signal transduction histidine kinase